VKLMFVIEPAVEYSNCKTCNSGNLVNAGGREAGEFIGGLVDLEVERFQPHEKQLRAVQGCFRIKQHGKDAMRQTLTNVMQH
jgi:hypothetical protein